MPMSAKAAGVLAGFILVACTGEFPTDVQEVRAAEDTFDRELLITSLNEIEAWHIRNDTGVEKNLAAGRNTASILADFDGIDCKPTEELRTLWSWRDGGIGAVPFIWYHDFLPSREALAEYKRLQRIPLLRWDPRYIPIFSFEGEWYAAYCGEGADNAGPVAHFFLEDEARITHTNLTMFLASMAEAFDTGAIRWENEGMAEDLRQVYRIHQKHNPGYSFPYYVPEEN